jgi:hypothetical protein
VRTYLKGVGHWVSTGKPRRPERYVLSEGEWKQPGTVSLAYRHSVRTPVTLVESFGDDAKFFLTGRPISAMGDIVEQTCSRQDLIKSAATMKVIFHLYRDQSKGSGKSGCTTFPRKKKLKNGKWSTSGKGSIRRLAVGVLPRLRLTYNTDRMDVAGFLKVAGPEFSVSKWNK